MNYFFLEVTNTSEEERRVMH